MNQPEAVPRRKSVLVLDGNENQAVACVRSLGRAGYSVRVGAPGSWSKAGWSRYAAGSFRYPAPEVDSEAFVERVAEQVERRPGAVVLPMTERSTLPLSAARERIARAGGLMVLPEHDVVLRAFDKELTTKLAGSLGIRVPATWRMDSVEDAHRLASELPYPLVLKPRASEEVLADGSVRSTGAPRYVRDEGELLNTFRELSRRSKAVLVQEYVEGSGAGFFALMRKGEVRAEFAHRRIRDVRPTGSGSAVRISVRPPAAVRQAGLAMLNALDWHGVAMVEFRLTRKGEPVFLEVNGRFWNSLPLAVHAGLDFPALLVSMAVDGDVAPTSDYQEGVRCRWLLGDIRHLLEVLRGPPAGYPGRYPGRLRTLVEVLRPVRGTYHDNFMLADPLPELGDWLDFGLRRLPRFIRRPDVSRGLRETQHA